MADSRAVAPEAATVSGLICEKGKSIYAMVSEKEVDEPAPKQFLYQQNKLFYITSNFKAGRALYQGVQKSTISGRASGLACTLPWPVDD